MNKALKDKLKNFAKSTKEASEKIGELRKKILNILNEDTKTWEEISKELADQFTDLIEKRPWLKVDNSYFRPHKIYAYRDNADNPFYQVIGESLSIDEESHEVSYNSSTLFEKPIGTNFNKMVIDKPTRLITKIDEIIDEIAPNIIEGTSRRRYDEIENLTIHESIIEGFTPRIYQYQRDGKTHEISFGKDVHPHGLPPFHNIDDEYVKTQISTLQAKLHDIINGENAR